MRRRWIGLALVLLGAALVAAFGMDAPFTYDDKIEVVGNPAVRADRWWLAVPAYNPWRTLVLLTYAINWQLGALEPRGYHVLSIAIHLANVGLVYRLLSGILSARQALLATALWGLHPLTTESVTYISGRSDSLVATWMLLALERWLVDARAANPGARWVALGATLLAFLSKETAVALPIILWVGEWSLVAGGRARLVRWQRYLPFGVIAAAALTLRFTWLGWPLPEVPRTASAHFFTQAEVWTRYLQLWVVPWGQSILHPVPARVSALGIASVVAWAGIAWWAIRAGGIATFAFALWACCLGVTSAFVLKETMAEHRSYLAGLGVAVFAATRLPGGRWAWLVPAALGVACASRNREWSSEIRLWEGAVRQWPASADAWFGYGDTLRFAARWEPAEDAYLRSVELDAERPDGWVNIGITRVERGDHVGATGAWNQALVVQPGHCAALNNLAFLQLEQGDPWAASGAFSATVRACPDDPTAHLQLGLLAADAGDQSRAIFHLRRYLEFAPEGGGRAQALSLLRRFGAVD